MPLFSTMIHIVNVSTITKQKGVESLEIFLRIHHVIRKRRTCTAAVCSCCRHLVHIHTYRCSVLTTVLHKLQSIFFGPLLFPTILNILQSANNIDFGWTMLYLHANGQLLAILLVLAVIICPAAYADDGNCQAKDGSSCQKTPSQWKYK